MPPEDRIRIQHMLDAAQTALQFTTGRSRTDLDSDRLLLFGVLHAVEILGEAASRVSDATRTQNPPVPWRSIVAMRNRLVHGYFDIDADIVWTTVTGELPLLIPLLIDLLNGSGQTSN